MYRLTSWFYLKNNFNNFWKCNLLYTSLGYPYFYRGVLENVWGRCLCVCLKICLFVGCTPLGFHAPLVFPAVSVRGAARLGFLCLRCSVGCSVLSSFFFPSSGFVGCLSPLPARGCLSSPFGWVCVSSLPVRFRVGLAWECVSLAFSSGGRGLGWFLSALALCFGFRSSSVSWGLSRLAPLSGSSESVLLYLLLGVSGVGDCYVNGYPYQDVWLDRGATSFRWV